ncbi:MAG: glycosyltransferase 87 family protein [Clostridia bacterium]|nr:glycosyltransferase 87 family protein [Clostridia bacterium]
MKRICALLLLSLLLLYAGFPAFAQEEALFSGAGTAKEPYLIQSQEDLIELREAVNGGTGFPGVYFLQTADLNLEDVAWEPIGIAYGGSYFSGVYDGGGHVIQGLHMEGVDDAGFFGMLGGTVINLGLENCEIDSDNRAGIITCYSAGKSAKIINCYATGVVEALTAGGLTNGFADGQILNCWFEGELYGVAVGGFFVAEAANVVHSFSNESSGVGDVPATDNEEMDREDLENELNRWNWAATKGSSYSIPAELCEWRMLDDELTLSEQRITKAAVAGSALSEALKEDVNGISISIAAIIALGGLALLIGYYGARLGKWKGAACLILSYLAVAFVGFCLGRYSFVLFHLWPQLIWEAAALVVPRMLVLSLCVFALNLKADDRRGKKRSLNPGIYFIALYALLQLFSLPLIAYFGPAGLPSALGTAKTGGRIAFFEQMVAARKSQFAAGISCGPLGWALLKLLGCLVPAELFADANAPMAIMNHPSGNAALSVFAGLGLVSMGVAAFFTLKHKKCAGWALTALLVVSGPFLAAIATGSMSLLAASCCLLFFYCMRSKKRVTRELAPVFLAAATGLFPAAAVFALVLAKRERLPALARYLGYCVILTVLPAALCFGRNAVSVLAASFNPIASAGGTAMGAGRVSFGGTLSYLAEMLTGISAYLPQFDIIGYLLCGLLAVAAFLNHGWRKALCLSLLACGIARNNTMAALTFMVIPLGLCAATASKEANKPQGLQLFLLICMFALLPAREITKIANLRLWQETSIGRPALAALTSGCLLIVSAVAAICETVRNRIARPRERMQHHEEEGNMKSSRSGKVGFLLACTGALMLFFLAETLLNQQSVATMLKLFVYQVFCMLVPGYALLRILRIKCRNPIQMFGFSYASGYCVSILAYIAAIPFSFFMENWMVWIARVNYLFAGLSLLYVVCSALRGKGPCQSFDKMRGVSSREWMLVFGLWIGMFVLSFLAQGLPNRLPDLGSEQAYYFDTLYWIGNGISLSRGFPPESMRGVGHIMSYHYLSSMQFASIEKATGIPVAVFGLAYTCGQSATLLFFGYYSLFKSLTQSRWKTVLALVLLFFSMGSVEKTGNFLTAHILTTPFGFDYAIAICGFGLQLLTGMAREKRIRWNESVLCVLFLGICLGAKAPIGVLMLGFEGVLCFIWLFDRKTWKKSVILGVASLVICGAVYLAFMMDTSGWQVATASESVPSEAAAGGGLNLSFNGTAAYAQVVKQWYGEEYANLRPVSRFVLLAKIILHYLFYSHMAVAFLGLCTVIAMFRHLRGNNAILYACIAVIIAGLALSLLISLEGYSQSYFIQGALPFGIILALYNPWKDGKEPAPASKAERVKWAVATPLIIACLLNAYLYVQPLVSDAVATMRTGSVQLTSYFSESYKSGIVTPLEAEGYRWIRENTDEDSILITNATVYTTSPLMTGVFTERRCWVESMKSPSVPKAIADVRIDQIVRFFTKDSRYAYGKMRDSGVTYSIVLSRFKTGDEYTRGLECVYSNEDIAIYRL